MNMHNNIIRLSTFSSDSEFARRNYEISYLHHRMNLQRARKVVDNRKKPRKKARGALLSAHEQAKQMEIMLQNMALHRHLQTIRRSKPHAYIPHDLTRPAKLKPSMNYRLRRAEAKRIAVENQHMIRHISEVSGVYESSSWETSFRRHRRHMKRMQRMRKRALNQRHKVQAHVKTLTEIVKQERKQGKEGFAKSPNDDDRSANNTKHSTDHNGSDSDMSRGKPKSTPKHHRGQSIHSIIKKVVSGNGRAPPKRRKTPRVKPGKPSGGKKRRPLSAMNGASTSDSRFRSSLRTRRPVKKDAYARLNPYYTPEEVGFNRKAWEAVNDSEPTALSPRGIHSRDRSQIGRHFNMRSRNVKSAGVLRGKGSKRHHQSQDRSSRDVKPEPAPPKQRHTDMYTSETSHRVRHASESRFFSAQLEADSDMLRGHEGDASSKAALEQSETALLQWQYLQDTLGDHQWRYGGSQGEGANQNANHYPNLADLPVQAGLPMALRVIDAPDVAEKPHARAESLVHRFSGERLAFDGPSDGDDLDLEHEARNEDWQEDLLFRSPELKATVLMASRNAQVPHSERDSVDGSQGQSTTPHTHSHTRPATAGVVKHGVLESPSDVNSHPNPSPNAHRPSTAHASRHTDVPVNSMQPYNAGVHAENGVVEGIPLAQTVHNTTHGSPSHQTRPSTAHANLPPQPSSHISGRARMYRHASAYRYMADHRSVPQSSTMARPSHSLAHGTPSRADPTPHQTGSPQQHGQAGRQGEVFERPQSAFAPDERRNLRMVRNREKKKKFVPYVEKRPTWQRLLDIEDMYEA